MANAFRSLPSVNDVLAVMTCRVPSYIHSVYVEAIRQELDVLRARLHAGESLDGAVNPEAIAAAVEKRIESNDRLRLRPVINATGIVLHTNLGRAPVAEAAARAAYEAARGYLNLELDLESGKRSSRQDAVREWICRLTGAESATAVNNNAAATVLVLRALCRGREVVISRGQLIEIGGSFRIPEIMAVSGAVLREVGPQRGPMDERVEVAVGDSHVDRMDPWGVVAPDAGDQRLADVGAVDESTAGFRDRGRGVAELGPGSHAGRIADRGDSRRGPVRDRPAGPVSRPGAR